MMQESSASPLGPKGPLALQEIHTDPSLAGRAGGESAESSPSSPPTFLTLVARDLLAKYGTDLSRLTVVFPGKRASLFLDQALARESATPVWTPRYTTIAELFADASPYQLATPVESVCRLHAVYARHVAEPYTLDQFYTWGEVLLSDFDDIDKHLVDAGQLFANITDLKALEGNDYITPAQEEALRAFFANFSLEGNSQLKRRFLELWQQMAAIYRDFKAEMCRAGLLYEGAMQREVVQRMCREGAADAFPQGTYLFVGFNVLHEVEERLFTHLQREGRARFYWDYDRYYMQDAAVPHEAGHFMRRNLQRYGNELPPHCFDNLLPAGADGCPKTLRVVAASSENAQARYVDQWLAGYLTHPENHTAVVLCNEALLAPVLHALPTDVPINVTMGYPVVETPVYSFVNSLLSLQTDGWDAARHRFRRAYLTTVQSHPLVGYVPEAVWKRLAGDGGELIAYLRQVLASVARASSALLSEAVFRCYESLGVLQRLAEGPAPLLCVGRATLRRLVRSVLRTLSVPFHGEPAIGLQVMGVLETRGLDFDHLLMLSVGEGYLPRATAEATLIPYALKEAFGLTTVRHQMAVYAYYFYRLVQRARHVTFVYNDSNAGSRQNEISRFLRQLMADPQLPISHYRLTADSNVQFRSPEAKPKTEQVMACMRRLFDNTDLQPDERPRYLSPTALNTYTTCPVQFYYKYVRGMKVNPDATDGLDAAVFGNVFHKAAQLVYEDLRRRGDTVRRQDLDYLLEQPEARLAPYIDRAFRLEYFEKRGEQPSYEGLLIIGRRAMHSYLERLLRHDCRLTPFRILGLETHCDTRLALGAELGMDLRTGGIIDRLDEVTDPATGQAVVRVVDYKTGGRPDSVSQLAKLFADTGQTEHYYFQTILYATIVASQRHVPVQPALFYVHKSGADDYTPALRLERQPIADVAPLADDFRERLDQLVRDIFNPDIPFTPTDNLKQCALCPYKMLCRR